MKFGYNVSDIITLKKMNQTEKFSVVNKPVVTLILSTLLEYIMLFGIVGNVISLFIFSRPCLNRKTNSGKLYAFLCLLSLIIIVYEMSDRKLESFFSFKIRMHLKTEKVINTIILQYWSWIASKYKKFYWYNPSTIFVLDSSTHYIWSFHRCFLPSQRCSNHG